MPIGPKRSDSAVEAEVAQAGDVVECDIEGVHPLAARHMASRFCHVRHTIQDDQPPFADGGLHLQSVLHSAMSIRPSCGSRVRIPCSPMHSSSAESASRRLNGRGRVRCVRKVCVRLTAEAPASLLPRPVQSVAFDGRRVRDRRCSCPDAPCRGGSSGAASAVPESDPLPPGPKRCCAVVRVPLRVPPGTRR